MTDREPARHGEPRASTAHFEPLPIDLLDSPLDYIFADHYRQRSLSAHLRRIAQERCVPRAAGEAILRFVADDLALHHGDEDRDLFTTLRRRALPEDDIEPILERLSAGHGQEREWVRLLKRHLDAQPQQEIVAIGRKCASAMLAYAVSEQRHLSLENGIVLVLARKRLTHADLAAMSLSMKARRQGAA